MWSSTAALPTEFPSGVDNLLLKCIGIKPGESVLLVLEPEGERFYEDAPAELIRQRINALDATSNVVRPDLITNPEDFPLSVADKMMEFDHTLFLSRIGDYCRFHELQGSGSKTLCYARTAETLNSPFAGACHRLMSTLLTKLEQELMQASHWRITCDLGTDIEGTFCWPSLEYGTDDEFSLELFPVTTFKPVPCNTANGVVAISRWLLPGAAAKVEPSMLSFDDVVIIEVENGNMTSNSGSGHSAEKVADYYDLVANHLGVNRNRVHSWHIGINPFTEFLDDVDRNLEKWGAISFASPRYLHFHTCGDVPPGELAWSIFNPTVIIDGHKFWHNGQFTWLQREDNHALLSNSDDGASFLQSSRDIGV
jgi:hypothetical protein